MFRCRLLVCALLAMLASCSPDVSKAIEPEEEPSPVAGGEGNGTMEDGNGADADSERDAWDKAIETVGAHDGAKVSYLVYMAADNDLEEDALKNLKSMQQVGSAEGVNMIVLLDRSAGHDASEDDRKGTDLFRVTENPLRMNDDIICEMGELDMSDSSNVRRFLEFASRCYPAQSMILNIWSHGLGVGMENAIPVTDGDGASVALSGKAVVRDDGAGGSSWMMVKELAREIGRFEEESGERIDLIQFDCCSMQMIEVAYQLRGVADHVVAPLTPMLSSGSDYAGIARTLNAGYDKESFPSFLVESFHERQRNGLINIAYSHVKTSAFGEFMESFDAFCADLITLTVSDPSAISRARSEQVLPDPSLPDFIDLMAFADSVGKESDASGIRDLSAAFGKLVPLCEATLEDASAFGGLGISFPLSGVKTAKGGGADALDFYSDSKWSAFLLQFHRLLV